MKRLLDWDTYYGISVLESLGKPKETCIETTTGPYWKCQGVTFSTVVQLVDPLTERELEVLNMIIHGNSNQEIADQLVITVGTVKAHVSRIFSKLDVCSRTQAVSKVNQLGLLS